MMIKTIVGYENLLLSFEYAEVTEMRDTQFLGLLETLNKDLKVYKVARQFDYMIDPEDEDSQIVDTGDTLEVRHSKLAFKVLFEEIKKLDLSDKAVRLKIHDYSADNVEVQHILKYLVAHASKYDLDTDLCDIIELSKSHIIDAHISFIERKRDSEDTEDI